MGVQISHCKYRSTITMPMAFALAMAVFGLCGCAMRYFDPETGIEHIVGFTHIKTKRVSSDEKLVAVIDETGVAGLALDVGKKDYGVTAGWDSVRKIEVARDESLTVHWPTTSFFEFRFGTNYPSIQVLQKK